MKQYDDEKGKEGEKTTGKVCESVRYNYHKETGEGSAPKDKTLGV